MLSTTSATCEQLLTGLTADANGKNGGVRGNAVDDVRGLQPHIVALAGLKGKLE